MIFLGYEYQNDEIKWKKIFIDGEETKYSISNIGIVRNDKTYKLMKTNFYKKYESVNLTINGKGKSYFIHILVAIAFIPNPENKPQVNHKDGNKSNNYDYNLEWVTASENMRHAFDNGLNKYNSDNFSRIPDKTVINICEDLNTGKSFSEIARIYGVSRQFVSDVYKRKIRCSITNNYDFSNYKIHDTDVVFGDENILTKVPDKKIHEVCSLIDSGEYSLPEIATMTKVPYQTVRNVYYGVCRKNIAKQYKFFNVENNPLYEQKRLKVIEICEMLDNGFNTKQVSELTGIKRSMIRNIRAGNTWKKISKNYSFCKWYGK